LAFYRWRLKWLEIDALDVCWFQKIWWFLWVFQRFGIVFVSKYCSSWDKLDLYEWSGARKTHKDTANFLSR
jgi:hypothetical protein